MKQTQSDKSQTPVGVRSPPDAARDRWTNKEWDSTLLLIGILFIFVGLIVGLFISDWFFAESRQEPYLTETLIGIIIGFSANWITTAVKDFFERRKMQMAENDRLAAQRAEIQGNAGQNSSAAADEGFK